MNFSIIGSGNIAHYFGERCLVAGHRIVEVISTNEETGQQLAQKLSTEYINDYKDSTCDTFLLAVPDDVIRSFSQTDFFKSKNIIHTSGSVGLNEIESLSEQIACLWPIYSVHKDKLPTRNDVPFVMQSSNQPIRKKAISLVKCMTNNVTDATDEQKAILHLVAVMVNNFSNHLFALSDKMLQAHDLKFDIMLPLAQDTTAKLSHSSALDLQTGPAKRGDQSTMQKHIDILKDNELLQEIYKLLSKSIQKGV